MINILIYCPSTPPSSRSIIINMSICNAKSRCGPKKVIAEDGELSFDSCYSSINLIIGHSIICLLCFVAAIISKFAATSHRRSTPATIGMREVFSILPPPPWTYLQINFALTNKLTDEFRLFFTRMTYVSIYMFYIFFGTEA